MKLLFCCQAVGTEWTLVEKVSPALFGFVCFGGVFLMLLLGCVCRACALPLARGRSLLRNKVPFSQYVCIGTPHSAK